MSRIGKKPVLLPSGVQVQLKGRSITISGPRGGLSWSYPAGVSVAHDANANTLTVTRAAHDSRHRALHGTTRALIHNMVVGVSEGYTRKLEIYGTGYGCSVSGRTLELNVGFAHPVKLAIPEGIQLDVEVPVARGDENPAKLTVSGIDKQAVGQFARTIKDARPPEPYKGKGIRFAGEQIRRKAGKAFAGAGG